MAKKESNGNVRKLTAQPRLHQRAPEIQAYGTVNHLLPLDLEEPVRLEMTEQLNQLLADTITLRDLYKKSHWQTSGPTFYQLHLLFDKHDLQSSFSTHSALLPNYLKERCRYTPPPPTQASFRTIIGSTGVQRYDL